MPALTLVVATSLTRRPKALAFLAGSATLRTKASGSCSLLRTTQATSAGSTPTMNMPRQPISGSSSGVSIAASSTPHCQPNAT